MVTRNVEELNAANGWNARGKRHERRRRAAVERWAGLQKAWRALGRRIPEMRDDASTYAAVQADRARLVVSQIVTRAVAGILLVIGMAAVFTHAVALVVAGIAGGLASALGGNVWLANLMTGTVVIVLLLSAIDIGVRVRRSKRLRRLQRRYDGRRQDSPRSSSMKPGVVPEEVRNHADRS